MSNSVGRCSCTELVVSVAGVVVILCASKSNGVKEVVIKTGSTVSAVVAVAVVAVMMVIVEVVVVVILTKR